MRVKSETHGLSGSFWSLHKPSLPVWASPFLCASSWCVDMNGPGHMCTVDSQNLLSLLENMELIPKSVDRCLLGKSQAAPELKLEPTGLRLGVLGTAAPLSSATVSVVISRFICI